ncbi:extracellular solute-binding protein [Cohnella suwonensis]|uniref:Extracellular solute-binding protein n=1 Tax=Cohnella suwonensis TaxID=696072 RepID=A0ABW0LMN5_9BACL
MARRKSVLVFLLFVLMVLVLSPWAKAPSPEPSVATFHVDGKAEANDDPVVTRPVSRLRVEAAMTEPQFRVLLGENERFSLSHPEITVELTRVDPERAYDRYKEASAMNESADIMLFNNEWVKQFASSGYLIPTDPAFVGKALAEQFNALTSPLKWNGFLWGVPFDMDPYVLLWNDRLLREALGPDVALPLALEQWTALADKSAASPTPYSWLAIDREDPLALLGWLQNAGGERSDGLWAKGSDPWDSPGTGGALSLLASRLSYVRYPLDVAEAIESVKRGEAAVAVVPYSDASEANAEPRGSAETELAIDHQSWRMPWVWPRGRSFVVSSSSESEEAAYVWISEMTGEQTQLANLEKLGKLPVFRTMYDSDRALSNLLPGRNGANFPNQAPLSAEPELPDELTALSDMWSRLAGSELTLDQWKERWNETAQGRSAADGQLND